MRYVGFSSQFHDAGLSIIEEDGSVSFAAHAERYSKVKNDPRLPYQLMELIKDDDVVSFYEDIETRSKLHNIRKEVFPTQMKSMSQGVTRAGNYGYVPEEIEGTYDVSHMHHESHVAQSLYTCPWKTNDDIVMVSIDGAGEEQTSVIYDVNFNVIDDVHDPQSIGKIYGHVTRTLGYRPLEHEYIVMGLSSYAEPDKKLVQFFTDYYESFSQYTREEFLRLKYTLNQKAIEEVQSGKVRGANLSNVYYRFPTMIADFEKKFIERLWKISWEYDAKVIAASVQEFTENKILEIMRTARKHGSKLVYSGGCAQNIIVNSKIRDMFDDVHIAIAPSDAGSSLGCAAKTWAEETGGKRLKWSPYLGYDIKNKINPKEVVDYLMKNKVCGVANGRAEFGPRALGNRSLLGDVRYDIKDTVNKIKRRELFRPFAPAILEEYADEYFDGHKNEYMQYTCNAKHDYKSVIHIDGTSRCQVVKKDCQSVLRQILEEYYERTGVPMLLNTSLNIKGQPILNNEQDVKEWQSKYKVRIF
tara:strand:+ start:783 stop:2366 length:1584 start_codon:yes stop_codon:yes gene_type:complete